MALFNSDAGRAVVARRVAILIGILIILLLGVSIVFFATGERWMRRVLFFPEVNTGRYVTEIRYLPPASTEAEDARRLLEDILLGPSNFGNALVLPQQTRLTSCMLQDGVLYAGFSTGIFQTDENQGRPRDKLQAVANAVFFNFPGIRKVLFFIGGRELLDGPVANQTEVDLELARLLLARLESLKETVYFLSTDPLVPRYPAERDIFMFENGASWDERLF